MTDTETWFWSRYSQTDTDDEGAAGSSSEEQAQRLLDFVLPGRGLIAAELQGLP